MSLLFAVDSSHWVVLDIPILKANGVACVIAKATSGDYSQDARYASTMQACKQNAMMQASYHWNDPLTTARNQADKFLSAVDPFMDEQQFLAVDQEQWWANWAEWNAARAGNLPWAEVDKLSQNQINDTCRGICEILKRETGKKIVVYSNGFFVRDRCPQMFTWLQDYYQWWAQYPYDTKIKVTTDWVNFTKYYLPTVNEPSFPSGWQIEKHFDIWQFSGDKFYLPGCDGYIDVNYIDSNLLSETPAPFPYPEQVYLPSAINVRLDPWALDWGTTKTGKTVPVIGYKVDEEGRPWYSITAWIAGWLTRPK